MSAAIENLRIKLHQLEQRNAKTQEVLPFGVPEIDNQLPDKGLALGALHEISEGDNGVIHCAAATLFAAGIIARLKGPVLWCAKYKDLFAPGLTQAGLPMSRIIFVDAGDEKTLLACLEEGLRHGGVTAVVGEISKLSMTASRRLQLAAESSGSMGIAIRRFWRPQDAKEFDQPTAAKTRWKVTALPSVPLPVQGVGKARWMVELLRCRSGKPAQFAVEACNEKGYIALSSHLVNRQSAETVRKYAVH